MKCFHDLVLMSTNNPCCGQSHETRLDAHLNRLHGVVLMSVHNLCFGQRLDTKSNTCLNCSHKVILMTEKETKMKYKLGSSFELHPLGSSNGTQN